MDIIHEVRIDMSVNDVKDILKNHIEKKYGISVDEIYFNVKAFEHEGDWNSSSPLDYRLDNIIATGQVKIK